MKRLAAALGLAVAALSGQRSFAGIFPESAFSDKAAGTTSAAFLKLPSGARAEALGGSFAAAASGADALFWNPAGLASLQEPAASDASMSYNLLLEGSYSSALAFARPTARFGVLAAGLVYFSAGGLDGYNSLGDPTGGFVHYDLAFMGAWARKLESVSVGAGLKVVSSEVPGAAAATVALDLGVQAPRVTELGETPVDAGLSLRHLGPPLTMGSSSDPLPMKLQGGLLWHINSRLSGLVDGHFAVDQDPYATLGVEGLLPFIGGGKAGIRAGYDMSHQRGLDGLTGLGVGFGLDMARFRVDYAWVPFGDLGSTNRVTFGFTF